MSPARVLYFFLLLTFSAVQTNAQSIKIEGKVLDALDRFALPGASIQLVDGGTVTDNDGNFRLEATQGATLIVTYIGYQEQSITVSATEPELIIFLEPEVKDIGEVVISVSKFEQQAEEVTVSIVPISPDAIAQQASSSLKKVLDQTPGVVAYQNQLTIRGSNGYTFGVGSRVSLLLDGLPMMTADQASIDFEFLPTDNIKKMEVIKGASSVLYGSGALGGVVSVFTERPTAKPKTTVRLRQEVFDRPKNKDILWDGIEQGFSNSAHFFHSRRIGNNLDFSLQVDGINDDGHRQEEFTRTARARTSLHYFPEKIPGLRFGASVGGSKEKQALFITWASYPDSAMYQGEIGLTEQEFTKIVIDPRISYINKLGNKHLYLGRTYISDRTTSGGFSDSRLYFNEYQYQHQFHEDLTIVSGLNHTYTTVDSDLFGKNTSSNFAAFSQADWRIGRLNLSGGFRYLYATIEGENLVNKPLFRAGANYRVGEATFLRASIGQGIRTPAPAERYVTVTIGALTVTPNPELGVEEGYTSELGVRQLWKAGEWEGLIDAAAFQMRFNDMVDYQISDPDSLDFFDLSAQFRAVNISDVRVNGLELMLGARRSWDNSSLNIQGGYTYIDPQDLNGIPEQDDLYNITEAQLDTITFESLFDYHIVLGPDQPTTLKYRNKHMIRATTSYQRGRYTATANYRFLSPLTNADKIMYYEPFMLVEPIQENLDASGFSASPEQSEAFANLLAGQSRPLVPGVYEYQQQLPNGYHFVDLILSAEFGAHTISLHGFNLTNTEYMPIAGYLMPHRSYAIQYRLTL